VNTCFTRNSHRVVPGFTLVELLIVVGIISVLVGILLPIVGRVRSSAREVVCLNNLRTFGAGITAYLGASEGVIPWDGYAEGDRPERHLGPWNDTAVWFNAAPRYAGAKGWSDLQSGGGPMPRSGDKSIFVCPEAGDPASANGEDVIDDGYYLLWGLDVSGTPVQRKTFWCYAFNTQLDNRKEDRHSNQRVVCRIGRIRQPELTVVLLEKVMRGNEYERPAGNVPFNQPSVGQQQSGPGNMAARHHGGAHLLFLDGHAAWWSRKTVLNDAPFRPLDFNQPGIVLWH
jgi:prepilin-type N-terminal cleavage/methylation domain-containing protein/prepilin-type processing-associated H-X9-DG protein